MQPIQRGEFSLEVIMLPVSDVGRALRFYVDRVGLTLDVDYVPNEALRVVQLTEAERNILLQRGIKVSAIRRKA